MHNSLQGLCYPTYVDIICIVFTVPTPIGKMSGYLGSAFFIGNFAGSMIWGWLSDIMGRKLVILLGLSGTIFSQLMFGFSQNFGWAIASRFLWGLLNGNLGVVKTYVSEVRFPFKHTLTHHIADGSTVINVLWPGCSNSTLQSFVHYETFSSVVVSDKMFKKSQ